MAKDTNATSATVVAVPATAPSSTADAMVASTTAPANTNVAGPVKVPVTVVFSRPSWQPRKGKRLAEVELHLGNAPIAFAGIGLTQADGARDLTVFMPNDGQYSKVKAIRGKLIPAQTEEGTTVYAESRKGIAEIDKLSGAIVDAWAEANAVSADVFGKPIRTDYMLSL